jgi:hypothetical protein
MRHTIAIQNLRPRVAGGKGVVVMRTVSHVGWRWFAKLTGGAARDRRQSDQSQVNFHYIISHVPSALDPDLNTNLYGQRRVVDSASPLPHVPLWTMPVQPSSLYTWISPQPRRRPLPIPAFAPRSLPRPSSSSARSSSRCPLRLSSVVSLHLDSLPFPVLTIVLRLYIMFIH